MSHYKLCQWKNIVGVIVFTKTPNSGGLVFICMIKMFVYKKYNKIK